MIDTTVCMVGAACLSHQLNIFSVTLVSLCCLETQLSLPISVTLFFSGLVILLLATFVSHRLLPSGFLVDLDFSVFFFLSSNLCHVVKNKKQFHVNLSVYILCRKIMKIWVAIYVYLLKLKACSIVVFNLLLPHCSVLKSTVAWTRVARFTTSVILHRTF